MSLIDPQQINTVFQIIKKIGLLLSVINIMFNIQIQIRKIFIFFILKFFINHVLPTFIKELMFANVN